MSVLRQQPEVVVTYKACFVLEPLYPFIIVTHNKPFKKQQPCILRLWQP